MATRTRAPAGAQEYWAGWPVRSGGVPPLAAGYIARPESAPDLDALLVPGATAVLTPGEPAGAGSAEWLQASGKTQLAVAFAQSLWQSGQADLVAWVSVASRESVLTGYAAAADAAGISVARDGESAAARFVAWLGRTTRRWLVVLDGLHDAADLDGLWPEGQSGAVLITAADPEAVPGERRPVVLPVGPYSTREAVRYLMGRLNANPDQRLGAMDLVADLGCEPAALAHASAVIADSEQSCRDYRDLFERRRKLVGKAAAAASVTWTLSVEQADRLSPGGGAQFLLGIAALLDGSGIPATVFTAAAACEYLASGGIVAAASPERARETLLCLERAGLLTLDTGTAPPVVRISPALQHAVRAAMPGALAGRAAKAAADALAETWSDLDQDRPDYPLRWPAAGLRACTTSLLEAAGDQLWAAGAPHPLLERAGLSLDRARLTGPAVAYWTKLATTGDRLLGPDNPATLMAGSRLAEALVAAGRADESIPWCEWVLSSPLSRHSPDDPAVIAARLGIGRAHLAAGRPGEALAALDSAVAEWERTLGDGHPATLIARDELASASHAAGEPAGAIELYMHTLADREHFQGPRHPDTIATRQQLADAYLADGQSKAGIAEYRRVLADRERVLGAGHIDTIEARGRLAAACYLAGRTAMAAELLEETRDGLDRVLGADHPDTLTCCTKLAQAYYTVGRIDDAAELLRDTVIRCERVLPPGDPLMQTALETLADLAG
jgi:tetratricopeptide (TPR) repeat protein